LKNVNQKLNGFQGSKVLVSKATNLEDVLSLMLCKVKYLLISIHLCVISNTYVHMKDDKRGWIRRFQIIA